MAQEQREIANVLSDMGMDRSLIQTMTNVNQRKESLQSIKK